MLDLRKIRTERALTQKKLADAVSVSRQMIGLIECGKAHPGVKLAKRIASVLGLDWTLFYTDK